MKIQHLALISSVLGLVLTSGAAFAQSSSNDSKPQPRPMSAEELQSFCKRYPMNSQCKGTSNTPTTGSPEETTSPNTTSPSSPAPSESTSPGNSDRPSSSPSDSITAPGSTAPGSPDQPSSSPSDSLTVPDSPAPDTVPDLNSPSKPDANGDSQASPDINQPGSSKQK